LHGGYQVGAWTIDCLPSILVCTLLLQQYRLNGVVEPRVGDVALDIGAYKGETALWLAEKIGSLGKVFAFEPNAKNRLVLESNVRRNGSPSMASIRVMPCGVSSTSGMRSFFGMAAGSSVINDTGETRIEVASIDDTVRDERIERVDFIKMDIEGGEVDALAGARETISRFGPKLAICVYHKPRDLPDIVQSIWKDRQDYKFYLSHSSPELQETVLFAKVGKGN